MGSVPEGVEDGADFVFNIIGQVKGVDGGNGQIFGKSTTAIDANANCIAAQMAFTGSAVSAVTAGDVAFP